jgi:4-amino-4-deoxy-L-arabinose transferase-like glycosyltransferase
MYQHDSAAIEGEWGHASYIYEVAEEGLAQLSHNPMERWSFYNPPLHYWLAAVVFNLFRALGMDEAWAMERVQYLTLLYTALATLLGVFVLRQLGLRGRRLDIAASAWCVLPATIILSGQLSPDALLLLLSLGSISATLWWYEAPSLARSLLVGLLCGLCIMTKTSGVLVLAFPGLAMLMAAVLNRPRLAPSQAVLYSLCALGLAAVVGGWWHVYMLMAHGMPLGYMQRPTLPDPQYIGPQSLLSRLLIPAGALDTPFIVLGRGAPHPVDSSIILSELKYVAFDELVAEDALSIAFAWVLLLAVALLFAVKLAAYVVWLAHSKGKLYAVREGEQKRLDVQLFAVVGVLVYVAAALYLSLKEPLTCSMSFRYIVPISALLSYFVGAAINHAQARRAVWAIICYTALAQALFYIHLVLVAV